MKNIKFGELDRKAIKEAILPIAALRELQPNLSFSGKQIDKAAGQLFDEYHEQWEVPATKKIMGKVDKFAAQDASLACRQANQQKGSGSMVDETLGEGRCWRV